MKKYLTYDDVALVPQYSTVESRSNCETETWLGEYQFKVPVMPANMSCVISESVAFLLDAHRYFYVMHRFGDTEAFIKRANQLSFRVVSISIGVKQQDYELIDFLCENKKHLKVHYITIDIAHGHCAALISMVKYIRRRLPEVFVIAGNIATPEAYIDLADAGADAVKVGIGQGAACTTKLKTGFTMPMFSCIQNVRAAQLEVGARMDAPIIIADGGIKYNGDIAKALVAGAQWVMAGGLFAKSVDSPAHFDPVTQEKVYYGSASDKNKIEKKHIEGTTINMQSSGLTMLETFSEITEDLKSAISYAGKTSALDMYNIDYIRV